MRYLLFVLPGLCHVGCARMAGQKYLIKMFLFGFRGERHGVLPGSPLCASRVLFIFPALSLHLLPVTLHRSGGYLLLDWSCDFDLFKDK